MFFHLRVFLHSLFFFLVLELVFRETVSDFLASLLSDNLSLLIILMIAFVISISVSALKIGKRWGMVSVPVVIAVSSVGLIPFIDSDSKKFAFILLAWAVYYACLLGLYRFRSYQKDQTARGIISATSMASLFLFYSVVYGIYLNFSIPLWLVMCAFLFPTVLVSFQYFQLVKKEKREVWLYSLVMGLVMAEMFWVLNFWPFGYLTTGVMMLIFYYIFWSIANNHFLSAISKKRTVANIVFFGILATMVLMSSRWLPVV